ncbi:hypothetical protein ACET3Z_011048 [Daucus carota]
MRLVHCSGDWDRVTVTDSGLSTLFLFSRDNHCPKTLWYGILIPLQFSRVIGQRVEYACKSRVELKEHGFVEIPKHNQC